MTSARIPSDFSAPQQLRFPFCPCGATVLTIEKTATCAKCGHTLVRKGMAIKVGSSKPDGKPHPHAGKIGRITKCINIYSDPNWLGPPSAMIELNSEPREFIWVSIASLEILSVSSNEALQKKLALTPGECKILAGLEARHSIKEIAEYFRISEDTAAFHVSNIYGKLCKALKPVGGH
jgi:DNA-binding CsgD family transcriptional regulator